jgi:hypothetical protein
MAYAEAEFLDIIGTKLLRVFLLAIQSQSPLLTEFYSPPPLKQKWFKTGLECKHCIRKPQSSSLITSNNSAQKRQRNCTFMSLASGLLRERKWREIRNVIRIPEVSLLYFNHCKIINLKTEDRSLFIYFFYGAYKYITQHTTVCTASAWYVGFLEKNFYAAVIFNSLSWTLHSAYSGRFGEY